MRRGILIPALGLLAIALADLGIAADPTTVSSGVDGVAIAGQVKTPQRFSADDLRSFPATTVDVSFVTEHGHEAGKFSGPLLWGILEKAALML